MPALVIDRLGPVPGDRPRRWAGLPRPALRAAGVRLLGYLAWLAVRLALGLSARSRCTTSALAATGTAGWRRIGVWSVVVNAVAYPTLACLDAVLHLETRMRTEGLDISLSPAPPRHGPLGAAPRWR